jgi:putative phosphoribosyl transferase
MQHLSHSSSSRFHNRTDAGQQLAERLATLESCSDGIVLALPRGGVPVAYEVAKALHLPLDLCLVRKLGVPGQKELAMGAIAAGGVRVLNQSLVKRLGIPDAAVQHITAQEQAELARRANVYRQGKPQPDITGKTVILVDDGIATGSTLQAAITLLKKQQPERIVVAVPVAHPDIIATLKQEVDELVCVLMPDQLSSISLWYDIFDQTSDAEVCELLHQSSTF